MAARVVAFLAALAMVAGALAVRAAMDSDGGSGGSGNGKFVLVCASELGELCDELDATKEAANATADRLIALGANEDPGLDAWLVPGPWPEMVDQVRDLDGKAPVFSHHDALASSRLVVVTRGDKIDAACAADWSCIADGSPPVGAPSVTDAVGVLARAAVLSARLESSDYGRADIEREAGWLTDVSSRLDRSQFQAGSLRRFLTTPGSADGFITTRAASTDAGVDDPKSPEPAVEVPLMLGRREGADQPDGLTDRALDHGWSPVETPGAVDSGLPSPDVLYALQEYL